MSVSTDGIICYGIMLDEGVELPWHDEGENYGDIETWWLRGILGWKSSAEIYDHSTKTGYINNTPPTKEAKDKYYEELFTFEKANPVPVEIINVCSGQYPMWMIAARGTELRSYRGGPEVFDPTALVVSREQKQALMDFCASYGIETNGTEPHWYLSSYWG